MVQRLQKKTLANRYNILKKIGKGATGTLYNAYDTKTESIVAIKLLHSYNPKDALVLKREFRRLSIASNDHLVDFYNLYIKGELCFFTMEWINGRSVFESVREKPNLCGQALNYDLLRKIIIQLAEGIQYLHNMGILHRDIKPDNILVDACGRAVLLDFGLARRFRGYLPEWDDLQRIDGTFAYMSPEVLQGFVPLPASDWYSLGAMLYECLTGKLPNVILGIDPTPPVSLVPDTPADLNKIALALLNRDPGLRPSESDIVQVLNKVDLFSFLDFPAIEFSNQSQNREFTGRIQDFFLDNNFFKKIMQRNQMILIQGAPGMGKTVLAEKFIARAAKEQNALILRSKCSPFEKIPFNAVDELIDELSRFIEYSDSEFLNNIAHHNTNSLLRLFPLLKHVFYKQHEKPSGYILKISGSRSGAVNAIACILNNIAEVRPVVLFIDDFQWSDYDSVCFITELFQYLNPKDIMLLLNMRDDENTAYQLLLKRMLKCKIENVTVHTINMVPFDKIESQHAVENYLSKGHENTNQVIDESAGIPYFIDILSKFVQERSLEKRRKKKRAQSCPILSVIVYHNFPVMPDRSLNLPQLQENPLILTRHYTL